ncbi:12290_t:CDS:2, partial [Dentiscutata heterogama]
EEIESRKDIKQGFEDHIDNEINEIANSLESSYSKERREKANSTHHFAICRSYKCAYPNKEESELKFVNKKTTCKNHLHNCEVFHNEVTSEEYERILNLGSKFVQPLDYKDDGENSCSSSQSQISLLLKISKKTKIK